jgi:hypothetical protein
MKRTSSSKSNSMVKVEFEKLGPKTPKGFGSSTKYRIAAELRENSYSGFEDVVNEENTESQSPSLVPLDLKTLKERFFEQCQKDGYL